MAAVLRLNLPWLPDEPDHLGGLVVSRGRDDVLTYDDGISLRVVVLDPSSCVSAEELVASARAAGEPGRVVLVAGSVPAEWRAALRHAEVSFIDVGGVAWIAWPRLRASSGRLAGPEVVRRRATGSRLSRNSRGVRGSVLLPRRGRSLNWPGSAWWSGRRTGVRFPSGSPTWRRWRIFWRTGRRGQELRSSVGTRGAGPSEM